MLRPYDAHFHLQFPALRAHGEAVARAWAQVNFAGGVVNGTNPADWPAVAEMCAKDARLVPSFGLHPWNVNLRPEGWLQALRERLEADPAAAIGECGLDKWIRDYDLEAQKRCLRAQLQLAAQLGRPVTLHCLQAFGHLLDELKNAPSLPRGFLLHAYSGPLELLDEFIALGARFSFNLYFKHERKSRQREVFRAVPIERLLAETDAPAMPPPTDCNDFPLHEASGEVLNHPGNIAAAYRELANLRGDDPEDLACALEHNFIELFAPTKRPTS